MYVCMYVWNINKISQYIVKVKAGTLRVAGYSYIVSRWASVRRRMDYILSNAVREVGSTPVKSTHKAGE